jgi:hypothetical protein
VVSVQSLDREELEFALAYLMGALPCKAKGVAIVTLDGELVGQYLTHHDGVQIEALLSIAHKLTCGFTRAMGVGQFRYNLNVGVDGATLTLLLADEYLVCINVREPKSLDAFVNGVREGLPPLQELLGLR